MGKEIINPRDNDDLVRLKGIDLQELIVQVADEFLEYRDSLGLPSNITFGTEIEYEDVRRSTVDDFVESMLPLWNSKCDASLLIGGEVASPVMSDELRYWKDLKLICDYLTKLKANTAHRAGGHVHIGAHVLGSDMEAWKLFLKLYTIYEHVILRFAYGDKINARESMSQYAKPVADKLYRRLDYINNPQDIWFLDTYVFSKIDRYSALNFLNVGTGFFLNRKTNKHTIEFRSPNATTDPVIWQNNINVFSKMMLASKQKVMDEDFLNYKLDKEFIGFSNNEPIYDIINFKDALEFADLIFNNNLDKLYFLRQYFKDFREGYGAKTTIKAKTFVKGR